MDGPHSAFHTGVDSADSSRAPRREWLLLYVLAAIQFTHIMDFVIIMPLGPSLMREFSIGPGQFGFIVSSYTFSAAIFGLLLAFVIDNYDRRTALLTLYAGFGISTLLCALAPSYPLLLAARIVAGACGGVLTAVTYSIVGDAVPDSRRGAALGVVMSAFAMASIAGVPFGLFLASKSTWHAPFFLLGAASLTVLVIASRILPSMRQHLAGQPGEAPKSPARIDDIRKLILNPNHLRAFTLMIMVNMAGFAVIPYISPYLVGNVGIRESDLAYLYLVGGAFTLFTSRLVGHISDRFGKLRVFKVAAVVSVIPIMLITLLPRVPLGVAIGVSAVFMIMMNARMVPAVAMVTGSVAPAQRGSFMSINSSVQQLGIGLASFLAGLILGRTPSGELENYWIAGVIASLFTLICIPLARRIRQVS